MHARMGAWETTMDRLSMGSGAVMTRRQLLGGVLGFGASAWCGVWSPAHAASASKVVDVKQGRRGTTITLTLEHAPFPCRGEPYKDATTLVYVPSHFRLPANKAIDVLVHFHGHSTNVHQAIREHQLREQLLDSKQNAILVLPQGPLNAASGSAGKFGHKKGFVKFLTDLRRTLQSRKISRRLGRATVRHGRARIGRVALSAHSGGYHAAALCLERGGYEVNEVYLFDSLYGDRERFAKWVLEGKRKRGRARHKLVCYYGWGKVAEQSKRLMRELSAGGVEVLHEEKEGQLTRDQFTKGRAIFVRTRVGHTQVTLKHNALRDCLYASGFKRRLRSDWFKDADEQRRIDKR